MLIINQFADNIIEVCEVLHSFHNTKKTWWYYDMKNRMVNCMGKKNEVPNRKMSDSQYQWALNHYASKVPNFVL